MPQEITITPITSDINIANLDVKPNECYTNAYNLAKQNASVSLVEGVLIIIDNQNCGKCAAHAWNEVDGRHFDITSTLWIGDEHNQIKSLHYFPNLFHRSDELVHPDLFKFNSATCKDVKEINEQIAVQSASSEKSNSQ